MYTGGSMQLLECIVSKPGLLNNIKLKFDKDLTVIYGKNESGKTLIAKAIIDTLWGEFSGNFSLNGNTWDNMYSEVSFNNSSGRYRFIKDKKELFRINYNGFNSDTFGKGAEIFSRNSDSINNKNNDETWCVKLYESTNDRETARLFNKIDIRAFMETSFLPELIDVVKNRDSSCSEIKKILLNDSTNFYMLYENISDAFQPNGIATNINNSIFNEILKKENEIKKINKKLQIYEIQNLKSDRIKKEKNRLIKDSKNLAGELLEAREKKTRLTNVQSNIKKLSGIDEIIAEKNKEKYNELGKINSIAKLEERIKNQYPQFHNFDDINIKNLKNIQETYREVRDVHEDIENFYLLRTANKNKFKNIILTINITSICILAALFGISNYVYPMSFFNSYKIHYIIGLLGLSLVSSLLFLLYNILNSRSNELRQIMKNKSDVEKKLEETLQKNNVTLNEYKLEAIYEYLVKYFEEYGEYSISQTELQNIKDSLMESDHIKTIDEEIERLDSEKAIIKQEINNELRSFADETVIEINADKIEKLIQNKNLKIKSLKENINDNNRLVSQIEKELGAGNSQTNELNIFNEEKAGIQTSLSRLNNYRISIAYIMEILKEAIANREEKQITELANSAGKNFHFLTENQYTDSINDELIKRSIKGESLVNEVNPSILHLLLLSVKLALTDYFDDLEITLPLIIDEPFQQMDEQRIDRFKKLLDDISLKRQVIIFTRSTKYNDWGTYLEL